MEKDNLLAGTNYDAGLFGLELEPLDLRQQLVDTMSEEQLCSYRLRLDEELARTQR